MQKGKWNAKNIIAKDEPREEGGEARDYILGRIIENCNRNENESKRALWQQSWISQEAVYENKWKFFKKPLTKIKKTNGIIFYIFLQLFCLIVFYRGKYRKKNESKINENQKQKDKKIQENSKKN